MTQTLAACGRPFLIQNEARVAELLASTDWVVGDSGGEQWPAPASAALRRQIGEYWARAALMEHASIAAFARFTLQLMHLGAPRELIEESQRAMLDETNHGKACFSLAAHYLEMPVGPGPLLMAGALQDMDVEQIVTTAFREGCVGETIAALEARAACEAASAPHVQRVLAQIADDELRHAELAWRFVRWALDRGLPDVERILAGELARLEAEVGQVFSSRGTSNASEHGILTPEGKASVRRLALQNVIVPCGRELIARVRAHLPHRSGSRDQAPGYRLQATGFGGRRFEEPSRRAERLDPGARTPNSEA